MIYLSEREYRQHLAAIMGTPSNAAAWEFLESLMSYDDWQVFAQCEPGFPTEADFARIELLRRLELN